MTNISLASGLCRPLADEMAKETKIGRVTFRELTNEEARAKYGASFTLVGSKPASLEQAATATGNRAIKRLEDEVSKARKKP